MGLEWSKDISFAGLRKKASPMKSGYPDKMHMNLVFSDERTVDVKKTAIVGVIILIFIAVFVKFGVVDILEQVNHKNGELAVVENQLGDLEHQLTNYDKVQEEFETYAASQLSDEAGTVSVSEALGLIDKIIMPQARVSSISYDSNKLTLQFSNTDLDKIGRLVSELNKEDIVKTVNVSTATGDKSKLTDVMATMEIELERPRGEE